MHELRQNTATTILIGPFLDDTDGKTPETAIDVTTINCDLYKGITKSDLSLTASGGPNDCVHVANGYYSLELTVGNMDTLADGRLTFNVSGAMPFWENLKIVTTNYFDSKCSTDKLQVDVVQCGGSTVAAGAIPNAAADAAGGLPISDAGNLDLDTKLANTNEITSARMGALTDWIDGGRLDLLLDATKAKTDNLPSGIAKNTAISAFAAFMVLASDSATPATGKTVTCTISKDGGAFGASSNSVVEVSSGMYKIALIAAELNADVVTLRFTAAACNDRIITIHTS